MTAADRQRLRHQIDQAKRLQIAKAHGLNERPWTDDPGYIGDKTVAQIARQRRRDRKRIRNAA